MKIQNNIDEIKKEAVSFIDSLDKEVFIFGRNKYGISVCDWLKRLGFSIAGFIDDYTDEKTFHGYKIVKSSEPFGNHAIVNCSVEGQTTNVNKLIEKIKPSDSIEYLKLTLAYEAELLAIDYLVNADVIMKNSEEYESIYNLLNDERSKKEFENVINFRVNRDPKHLQDFDFRVDEQYFEDFLGLSDNAIMVDGGGFDGFTSSQFIQHYPKYGKIYYFEPSETSMIQSQKNLEGNANIEYHQKGLWNKTESLFFDCDLGNSSRLSNEGTTKIEVTSIDEVVDGGVDFIKLDIEGAEKEAITGGSKSIKKHKPCIAVCVYHNQSDFIDIPKLVLAINPDYKVYFRHYTQGTCESVMFFVDETGL